MVHKRHDPPLPCISYGRTGHDFCYLLNILSKGCMVDNTPTACLGDLIREDSEPTEKTGPEEAQYFHVRPPIGFI